METTLYLRREPGSEGNNVVAYRDEACTDRIGHWMWWQVHKPTARTTHVTLSGKRHKVAWAERLTADKA